MFNAELKSEWNEDICLLIKVDNHSYNYICECGEASGLGVKECQNTNAIFISHTHIDHFANFDTILRHQLGIGRKVVICGPEGIIDQVQHRIQSYRWNLISADAISYEVREITAPDSYRSATLNPPLWKKEDEKEVTDQPVFAEKEFTVECEILDHKTDSVAYLFKGKDKTKIELSQGMRGGKWVGELKAAYTQNDFDRIITVGATDYRAEELFHLIHVEKGKTLGVIMDHAASEANHQRIISRFSGCDELYIECFYKDEDQEAATKNHHSHASKSGEVAKACGVKKAVPVHFSRKYTREEVDEVIGQFRIARGA